MYGAILCPRSFGHAETVWFLSAIRLTGGRHRGFFFAALE